MNGLIDNTDIAIVLSGTIVPNATFVVHTDWRLRRLEYLQSIRYYKCFAPVYFLENSSYPLEGDPEFNHENVFIRKFPVSHFFSRGKGFQEFEMLDAWFKAEQNLPQRFIKVTGRYIVRNFDEIIAECRQEYQHDMIIDVVYNGVALTQLFYTTANAYARIFQDLYQACDDVRGEWIEKVSFKKLTGSNIRYRIFFHRPIFSRISGSTGSPAKEDSRFRALAKDMLRRISFAVNKRTILYYKI